MENKNLISEFDLSEEDKKKLLDEIKYFFEEEREEKIGIIASQKVLDFFLDTLGKYIYNKALDNSKEWFDNRLEDIEADFYAMYKQ